MVTEALNEHLVDTVHFQKKKLSYLNASVMVGIYTFILAKDEVYLSVGIHINEMSVQFYDSTM